MLNHRTSFNTAKHPIPPDIGLFLRCSVQDNQTYPKHAVTRPPDCRPPFPNTLIKTHVDNFLPSLPNLLLPPLSPSLCPEPRCVQQW
jgi:hypothetical protein